MDNKFTFLNSKKLKYLVGNANESIFIASPGLSDDVATALVNRSLKNDGIKIDIIFDPNPESIRLGYGTSEAIKTLQLNKINIREQPGLRIGILIIDDTNILFSPLPLIVETEPNSEEFPNAVILSSSETEKILKSEKQESLFGEEEIPPIGRTVFTKSRMKQIEDDLKERPAIKPDLARRMFVISSLFQFVDIEFKGARLQSHTFSLNGKDLGIKNNEVAKRVTARFKLFTDTQLKNIHSKYDFNSRLDKLKKHYLKYIQDYGAIIEYPKRKEFENELKSFEIFIESKKAEVKDDIVKLLIESRRKAFPWIKQNFKRLTKKELEEIIFPLSLERLDEFINRYLDRKFPTAEGLLNNISFSLKITNVSDQLIKDDKFRESIEKAFNMAFEEIVSTSQAVKITEQD